jgi:uncharacterized protein (TIGR01777 family)
MVIGIAGHNGFLGNLTKNYFKLKGDQIIEIDRIDFTNLNLLNNKISGCNVVINFIGFSINKRWNKSNRNLIIDSRINSTRLIINAINKSGKDIFLINTSAIGIYDLKNIHDENSLNFENDFLSTVVQKWESEVLKLNNKNIFVIIRLGIVIEVKGKFLNFFSIPFKYKFGAYFGNKYGSFSFIDSNDFLSALNFILKNNLKGIFNLVAPEYTTNIVISTILRNIYKTWFVFHVPDFILKVIFGEGYYVLKETPKVLPYRLLDVGFIFEYPTIELSLKHQLLKY